LIFFSRRNAIILLSRILVPPASAAKAATTTADVVEPEPHFHDAELIAGVVGGVLDLLKVSLFNKFTDDLLSSRAPVIRSARSVPGTVWGKGGANIF
jgi:hypothetical protein